MQYFSLPLTIIVGLYTYFGIKIIGVMQMRQGWQVSSIVLLKNSLELNNL